MGMRIVFGLMASHEPPAAVAQLVDALAPLRVVLHLDAARASQLKLERPNLSNVPHPSATGWGNWGFTRAILRTVRHAAEVHDFDYFQLLSPSCLPIRPIADFRAHILQERVDIHADLIQVECDDDTFMTFGYRTYLPGSTLRFRVLRRMRGWYFGAVPLVIAAPAHAAPGNHPDRLGRLCRAGAYATGCARRIRRPSFRACPATPHRQYLVRGASSCL